MEIYVIIITFAVICLAVYAALLWFDLRWAKKESALHEKWSVKWRETALGTQEKWRESIAELSNGGNEMAARYTEEIKQLRTSLESGQRIIQHPRSELDKFLHTDSGDL